MSHTTPLFVLLVFLSRGLLAQTEAETYFVNAEIQLMLGDTLGAMINYHSASLVSENAAQQYHYQGYIQYLQRDYLAAIAHYTRAVSFQPDHPANALIYFDRALAQEKLGGQQAAIADYGRSIQVKPSYLPGYYSQARLYTDTGQFQLAIQILTMVIRLDEANAEAYLMRGKAELKAGNHQAAWEDFTQSLALDADQPPVVELKRIAESNLGTASKLRQRR